MPDGTGAPGTYQPGCLLYVRPSESGSGQIEQPAYFRDLNLDQVEAALFEGRADYGLEPLFRQTLLSEDEMRHRHAVFRDLEDAELAQALREFAVSLSAIRGDLARIEPQRHRWQRARLWLDAAQAYCDGITRLRQALGERALGSTGLTLFRGYLGDYVESARFQTLASDARNSCRALAEVRYLVKLKGLHVSVRRYAGEPDYGETVTKTFARFQRGHDKEYRAEFQTRTSLNQVEERILDRVAMLFPDAFAALDRFSRNHPDPLDRNILAFEREIQFYLAYLDYLAPLRNLGLAFCYPDVDASAGITEAQNVFDLALAKKLGDGKRLPVLNDFALTGSERVLVITGPNQGGKTTLARTFGQVHHLTMLGVPVPGTEVRLRGASRILTCFAGDEDALGGRGKLESDIRTIVELVARADSKSVFIINELFSSTTLADARSLGKAVLERLIAAGATGVYVTFVDELASLGKATVSMVSQVADHDPTLRTYKVIRAPARGLAYAVELAEKFGLSYEQLRRRIVP